MKLNPLRRCWAEIDLSALRFNAAALRNLPGPGAGLMAVVKSDGYGHGLEQVAGALRSDVDWFCVANVTEALRILDYLPKNRPPILILSPLLPEEYHTATAHGFSCCVSNANEVEQYAAAAESLGQIAKLHAVVDTGMGRMGASVAEWNSLVRSVEQNPFCILEGVATHFPNADEDPVFTRNQIAKFRSLTESLHCEIHLANSAGMIDFSEEIDFATQARVGLSLYGISPVGETRINLRPVLTLKSRITIIRDIDPGTTISYGSTFTADRPMQVATVAAGYGDGYPRHLSGQGTDVLISGTRCPLLGRVTMDQIIVDVSHLENVSTGDEVILIGASGSETISAFEIAEKSGTIPWEILTGITSRVERCFF
ncbi:MAG: alanine racemase [Verrucomicrobiales bacterium]|nr:alanine racemase [Verrucomicrobiales bacterium]